MTESFDALVLGAGEAGTELASRALDAGRTVALAYRTPWGSTCLNAGCIPSKFLIHKARVAHLARTAGRHHVEVPEVRVDLAAMVRAKDALVRGHREEGHRAARGTPGLTLLEGEARFTAPGEVEVAGRRARSERVFIATGLRPKVPPIEGLDAVPFLTSETLMALETLPERLVVLGGGYVGCELAQAYRRFGAQVTLVQGPDRLLPREEEDAGEVVRRAFEEEGIRVLLGARGRRAEPRDGGGVRVHLDDGRAVEGSHLLLAVGRAPNTDGLRLDAAGVETDEKGFVKVDARLETSARGVYAIGDVNGHQPFTRVCQEEAKVAYANAFEDAGLAVKREALPHATFTDPVVATVGLLEREARGRGLRADAGLVTMDQVGRARLDGETRGFLKVVFDPSTRRILGATVVGVGADNLLVPFVAAIRRGGTLDDLARSVHVFPSLGEGVEGVARALLARLAPEVARGPLVTVPASPGEREVRDEMADLKCPTCSATFQSEQKLRDHERTAHPGMFQRR